MEGGILVEDGAVRRLPIDEASGYAGEGLLWIHLEGRDEQDLAFLKAHSDIPDVASNALTATETRPRCDPIEDGAIINLRGPGDLDPGDSDRLVSIRMWVRRGKVNSLTRRPLLATQAVVDAMKAWTAGATSARFKARARLAMTKPVLSPQSWRSPSKVTP